MHATAPAPTRATTSVVVSFGLINIPLSIYTTTEETRVARKEFTSVGNPVGRKPYDKVTGEDVEYADVVKMVELDGGALVPLTDDEIAEATGHRSGVAPIVGHVTLDELRTQFVTEKLYQLRPKTDKKSQGAVDRAFVLLTRTLAETGRAAMVRVSIRGAVAKWGAITPDGYLHIVHSADQVRGALPMPKVEVADAELDLAKQLLDAIPAVDPADVRDDSSERVAAFVATKVSAVAPTVTAAKPAAVPAQPDAIALLEASMAAIRAQRESA